MSRILNRLIAFAICLCMAPPAPAETITVLTRDGGPIAGPAIRHGASFAKETGTDVRVVQRPFSGLYGEIMIGFVTGQTEADVLIFPAAWLPDFAPYLSTVPYELVNSPLVQGVHPTYRDSLMRWQGEWKAITLDGDLHMGAYRRDLFEAPATRQAFERQFGRDLEPPRDWTEYEEIRAFFEGRSAPGTLSLAGTLESSVEGGQRLWYLFSHAAAYTAHPDHPGHFFFDPETMEPQISNPAWQRALQEYLSVVTPRKASFDSHSVRAGFAQGRSAMAIDWSDIGGVATDPETSTIRGKVGFFILPGSQDVWNPQSNAWDRLPTVRQVPFLAFGGWIAGVPLFSANPETAWDYVAWMAAPERANRDVTDGASGFNPYRLQQLEEQNRWSEIMGAEAAADYLEVLRDSLSAPQTAPDLRIPGYPAYMAALDEQVGMALSGLVTPEEALSTAALEWEQITDRLGRVSQLRHYREAMGLGVQAP